MAVIILSFNVHDMISNDVSQYKTSVVHCMKVNNLNFLYKKTRINCGLGYNIKEVSLLITKCQYVHIFVYF